MIVVITPEKCRDFIKLCLLLVSIVASELASLLVSYHWTAINSRSLYTDRFLSEVFCVCVCVCGNSVNGKRLKVVVAMAVPVEPLRQC